jgi:hypothetical protein
MTNYYTYRDDVPLLPGQTLGFTRGRGYYAHGTPTPNQATKNTTAYREPKAPSPARTPRAAPLPGSDPAHPVDRPDPPKPTSAPLPGSTPSTPVDRPDPRSRTATPNETQPNAAGKAEPAASPPSPAPVGPSTTPGAGPAPPAGPPKPRAVGPVAGLLDGSVYIAGEGAWHHIPDVQTFNALGLDWNAIAWYGELPGDIGDPIEPVPPDASSSAGLTPPSSTGVLQVAAKPARPKPRTGARRTALSASGSRISEPPPPIVVPATPQRPGSAPTKPGQMVILPTPVRRDNVKFTILSGQSGHVRVKVEVVPAFKSAGLTTVTVLVDGQRAGDPSRPHRRQGHHCRRVRGPDNKCQNDYFSCAKHDRS